MRLLRRKAPRNDILSIFQYHIGKEGVLLIIPAIDIKDGKCVRLFKGDYSQVKVYSENPVDMAKQFEQDGAKLIHVVDLDGAKKGELVNFETIKKIKQSINIDIEVGGGIRNRESIQRLVDIGVKRIILGTSVIENIGFLDEIKDYIRNIIISIDLKNKRLSTSGWLKETEMGYEEFIAKIMQFGINEVIVTDISKDGTLQGPNIQLYQELADKFPSLRIITSGGISQLDDVKAIINLKRKNIVGIIIGKAIYEGKVRLRDAIKLLTL